MRRLFPYFLTSFVILISAVQAQWIPSPIDTLTLNDVPDQSGPQALAIDSSGILHLVWRQAISGEGWRILYMFKKPGGGWSLPIEIPSSVSENGIPALAVEYTTGIVHVVWHGSETLEANNDIFYAKTDTSAILEVIALTSDTTDSKDPTIALDSLGYVHTSWIHSPFTAEAKVVYATDLSGSWTIQVLEESVPAESPCIYCYLGPPSIAVSSNGVAHISYVGTPFPDSTEIYSIHHIENEIPGGTNWKDETMLTDHEICAEYSSIQVGKDSALYLAICGPRGLPPLTYWTNFYFHRSGDSTEWDTPELATGPDALEQVVLALDTPHTVHLVTATGAAWFESHLVYSTNLLNNDWHTQTILNGYPTDDYHNPSLVIDRSNYGHLVFYNSEVYGEEPEEIMYTTSAQPLQSVEFIRGDGNGDWSVGILDAIYILQYRFIPGSPLPPCMDAADVDDNGAVEVSDAVYILRYSFIPGAPPPPAPFPDCGIDLTADGLSCEEHPCMGGGQTVRRKVGSVR